MSANIDEQNVEQVYRYYNGEKESFLLDVRTQEEFDEGRAKGAVLLPLQELTSSSVEALNVSKETKIFIICRSGRRSMFACEELAKFGYKDLVNVEGGTLAWEANGFPMDR